MPYRFGDFELDEQRVQLTRDGQPVQIEPQVFDVLRYLVERRGETVTKEEILDSVWGSRFVGESALTSRIKSARRAVGDDGTRQEVIRTVHGRGYTFVAPVEHREATPPAEGADAREAPDAATAGPVSSGSAAQSPLPVALNTLIGRDSMLERLEDDLGQTRLVTIVGPAGVGKTSVGLELARRVGPGRADGVVLVELVGVAGGDSEETLAAVATALDVNVRQHDSVEAAIIDMVATRDLLLLLDNCEHVIEPIAALVDKVLRVAPEVTVVATSREPLAVPGEHVHVLEPLEVDGLSSLPLEELATVPVIALFVERARAMDASFELTEATAPAVIEICRRLDGVPLALELAASRVQVLDAAELASRLDERLRLLRAVRRGADPRHNALGDAISWSYDLLDDDEKRLFTELAVFAGSFDLDDAESVCGGEDDVLDVLTRLTQRSMVAVRRSSTDGTRYAMLETLREFGLARLDDSQSAEHFRAHAAHFTAVAESIEQTLRGPDEARAVARGDRSFADLRAAQRFATMTGDLDLACRLVAGLGEYAMRTMRYEVLGWAATLAATLGDHDHELGPTVEALAGYWGFVRGNFDDSIQLVEGAAERQAQLGLPPLELVERVRANSLFMIGDVDGALISCAAMIEAAETSGDRSLIVHANYMSSIGASSVDLTELADERQRAAFAAARLTESPTDMASAWMARGFAITDDDDASLDAFASADRLARSVGNRWMSAFAASVGGSLRLVHDDVEHGCEQLAERVDLLYRAGEWGQLWITLARCFLGLARLGEQSLAVEVLGALEGHTSLDVAPVVPSVRKASLEARDRIEEDLGAERFETLAAAGAERPLPELVDRTRRALLGETPSTV